MSAIRVEFIGVGDASQQGLGHASIVVEAKQQRLLVDLGPGVLAAFFDRFQALPDAVFITHCHLDHIADFEKFFIKSWFSQPRKTPLLFIPAAIIPLLHQRVGTYPGALAEGGVNFWQAFQLVPVSESFEYQGFQYQVLPVRHHGLNSAFGLSLGDEFFYSGDTRPIVEILTKEVAASATIFHDCSVVANPSHTGIDDILREYPPAVRERLYCYHYHCADDVSHFTDAGLKVVSPGDVFMF